MHAVDVYPLVVKMFWYDPVESVVVLASIPSRMYSFSFHEAPDTGEI